MREAYTSGMIAGAVLLKSVARGQIDPSNAGTGKIKSAIAERFLADKTAARRDHFRKKIDNSVWKVYRRVAHFWAAHVNRADATGPFPCPTADLGVFLAISMEWCRLGEATKPPHSPPVLRMGEAIVPPPALKLPKGSLRFAEVAPILEKEETTRR